jgi:hypothetical protein
LLLLSNLIATVVIPIVMARDVNARRGLTKALLFTFVADVLFVFVVRYIYFRI